VHEPPLKASTFSPQVWYTRQREKVRRYLKQIDLSNGTTFSIKQHPQSGRHVLFVIYDSSNRPRWLVKRIGTAATAENWFYQHVAPKFAATVKCVANDRTRGTVVLEYVPCETLHDLGGLYPSASIDALANLGKPLADLHSMRFSSEIRPSRAILAIPKLDPVDAHFLINCSSAAFDFIKRVQQSATICDALKISESCSGVQGYIHADIKPDNILIHSSNQESNSLSIIDWELSGEGPVAWDLGCVIGSILLYWAPTLKLDADTQPSEWVVGTQIAFAKIYEAVQKLLQDYLDVFRAKQFAAPSRSEVAAYTSTYIVSRVAIESASHNALNARHLLFLLLAEGVMLHPEELFGDLEW
jgi:serine/threonine protein kinase